MPVLATVPEPKDPVPEPEPKDPVPVLAPVPELDPVPNDPLLDPVIDRSPVLQSRSLAVEDLWQPRMAAEGKQPRC